MTDKTTLPEGITNELLENIKVITNRKVLFRISKLGVKLAPKFGLSYDQVLEFLDLKKDDNKNDLNEKADKYSFLEGKEKDDFIKTLSEKDIKDIESELKAREEKGKKIAELPLKLAEFLYNEIKETDELPEDIKELFDIIALATGYDFETIDNTDLFIIAELFIRVFFKPQKDYSNALFLKIAFKILQSLFPQYESMKESLQAL
jgi:hypothetical protein